MASAMPGAEAKGADLPERGLTPSLCGPGMESVQQGAGVGCRSQEVGSLAAVALRQLVGAQHWAYLTRGQRCGDKALPVLPQQLPPGGLLWVPHELQGSPHTCASRRLALCWCSSHNPQPEVRTVCPRAALPLRCLGRACPPWLVATALRAQCGLPPWVPVLVQISPFYKDTSHPGLSPNDLIEPDDLCRDTVPR